MERSLDSFNIGPGSIIAGRFEVCERIGSGGMGQVYRVFDRELDNQVVAVKLLHPFLAQDESVFRRFRNEVLVARSLSHPNIVRTHDMGHTGEGYTYISMEYVDGVSLRERLCQRTGESPTEKISPQPMPLRDAAATMLQILAGVAYAHGKGVIHRDLKPANVLISSHGEVKLADFGTARIVGMDTSITRTGQVIGTPDYMSPEQIRGESLDTACDIYSLGVISYELATGRIPFAADSPVAVAFKHLNEPLPDFGMSLSEVPQWYREIAAKATAKQKSDRFASAAEFAHAILEHMPDLRGGTGFFPNDAGHYFASSSFPSAERATSLSTSQTLEQPASFQLGSPDNGGGETWRLDYGDGEKKPQIPSSQHKPRAVREARSGSRFFFWSTFIVLVVLLGVGAVRWIPGLNQRAQTLLAPQGMEQESKSPRLAALLGVSTGKRREPHVRAPRPVRQDQAALAARKDDAVQKQSAEVDVKKQPVREATVDVVEPEPKKEVVGAAEGERKQAAASAAPEKTPQPAQTPHAVPGITPTAVPVVAPAVPERAAESAAVAAAAQKDVPTIQTQAPVLPSPTPELQPSATAVPSLPVQAVMTLRRGDRVLAVEDSFSADSLAAIRWSAAVTGLAVGEGKGERDGVLREFSLNFFSVRDARLLGRIAPEAISPQPEAKSLMVEGSLSGAGRYDPGVGDYRLDLVYRGEVLTSRSFSLYKARVTAGAAVDAASSISPGGAVAVVRGPAAGGPPEVEPAREPAATEQNLAHIRPVKPVLPSTGELAPPVSGVGQNETQESSTLLSSYETARKDMEPGYPDLGGLPPARGSSQGQAPLRRQAPPPQLPFGEGMERLPQLPAEQPPVLAGKMAGQQTQPAITGEENYRGKLNLVGDSGLEEPREMTMALVVRGDEVEGSARIAGLGEFSARGKVYPRGIELTLAGGGYALQLSGARYARSLRGRYSLPARNLRGVWSADRID